MALHLKNILGGIVIDNSQLAAVFCQMNIFLAVAYCYKLLMFGI